ncbi:MAG: cbb3-type cytochrome c oxidase subunit I [Blastocatellia bacterium]|nr:cbb3-type cytochrome c oxidase subunit I [Blastocatellia bacterium]
MTTDIRLSPWWRHAVILVLIGGFTILIALAAKTYKDAPPIPGQVVDPQGRVLFTREDILGGQEIFLRYGLMENGTIWGHGAYLGPDFSAEYLRTLGQDTAAWIARERFGRDPEALTESERNAVLAEVPRLLKQNRYDPERRILVFTEPEALSYERQIAKWTDYFAHPAQNMGLPAAYIRDPEELRRLTAFFAWTAWASVAPRPGRTYSYTNNFPYDPAVGNTPTSEAVLWSALSLIALLGGLAVVLFAFGRFDYLGWKGRKGHAHPQLLPGQATPGQRAVLKYFVIVALLFLAQVLAGGAIAHYRADPTSFYGLDLSRWLPSHILRTWHLQLAIFWIATAYIAGGLFLAPALSGHEPRQQARGINWLFAALVLVVAGSLLGEFLGVHGLMDRLWFWFGHQGWEYLDLGRAWQILLAGGLLLWLVLLFRTIAPARQDPERREILSLFLYAAVAIPLFYLPAMFFTGRSHFSVVDTWRFWIIHLWVEGFFELFVTVMVAAIFYRLGLVSHTTAARVVYLDALLYLGSGIVGTGHHWYWTGQSHITMALGATFSAMEVIPLTLLTLDAWDFIKLTRQRCDVCDRPISVPHRWTFYFLMAVGFWNFVGAGVFGFLINLPIVSYFEVGTLLTSNHGHAAMMGVFGMLAVALMVFAFRQALSEERWTTVEPLVRLSFWGLNLGLALMVVLNLFPGGVLQLLDVLRNGYAHARSVEFLNQPIMRWIEWLRLPADVVFIVVGVVPLVLAAVRTYRSVRAERQAGVPEVSAAPPLA